MTSPTLTDTIVVVGGGGGCLENRDKLITDGQATGMRCQGEDHTAPVYLHKWSNGQQRFSLKTIRIWNSNFYFPIYFLQFFILDTISIF